MSSSPVTPMGRSGIYPASLESSRADSPQLSRREKTTVPGRACSSTGARSMSPREGRILRITPDGQITALVDGLPSMGDHHTNGRALYGWLRRFTHRHGVPCRDIRLTGKNFESGSPFTPQDDKAMTGAFVPFGTATTKGQVIRGEVPCNGAIMRIQPEGGTLELIAWGFRNPFGLAFSPEGRLFATDNSYDDRGSRPIHGTGDLLWEVTPGRLYGWPDFHGARALDQGDHFVPPGKTRPALLLATPPNPPPTPTAVLGVRFSSDGFDFSRNPAFGRLGQAFVAQFGDQAPQVGKVVASVGFKVVCVDVHTGVIEKFAVNKGKENGPASKIGGGGLERPVAARFDPTGSSLYVVDFGVITFGPGGKVREPWTKPQATAEPRKGTGVLWRISRE